MEKNLLRKRPLFVMIIFLLLSTLAPLDAAIRAISFSPSLIARTTQGRGVGYDEGYSTLGILAGSKWLNCCFQPFIDLRADAFNDGKMAASGGIGGRYRNAYNGMVLGLNAYYDYRHSKIDYQQVGMGLEIGGKGFFLRANGYVPVGRKTHVLHVEDFIVVEQFSLRHRHLQQALGGFDAEVETSLRRLSPNYSKCWNPYLAIGPYYFKGKFGDHIRGGRIRFGLQYMDCLSLEVKTTFDNVYHTITQGVVSLMFPLGGSSCFPTNWCEPCCQRCYVQPVQRNDIIVLHKECVVQKCEWIADCARGTR